MIDRETLHQFVLRMGYTQEQADAYCEWYFGPYGWEWSIDQAVAAFEAVKQAIVQAADQMEEYLAELQELAYDDQPHKERRRPPRYAGPANKGRPWTRQPPRVARSCCRKSRR